MTCRRALLLAVALLAAGCGSDSPASPSSNSTTATVAPATLTETYSSSLPIGGSKFYSFMVVQNGTVNLTLQSLGESIGTDVAIELTLGQPAGTGCTPKTTVTVSLDTAAPHVTGTFAPGVYCARVADVGNLPATAPFTVLIEHS